MPPYLLGISTGLIMAVSTGPVFLTLLQNSLTHGFRKALFFILGVAIADGGIIMLTWLGMSQVSTDQPSPYLSLAGGSLLLVLGLYYVFKKKPENEVSEEQKSAKGNMAFLALFTQGFMLSAVNPIVWGFWAAISKYALSTFSNPSMELGYFFGIMNTIWLTDVLKAYYAEKLKKYMSQKIQRYLTIGIGLVLLGLGAKLLIEQLIIFLQ